MDAIFSGSKTILAGFGNLEADEAASNSAQEGPGIPSDGPLMVVPDSRGRIRNWVLIRRQQPYWRDAIALVSAATPREYLASLESEGVECILTGGDHVDFWAALDEFNSRYGLVSPDDAIGTRLTHVEELRNGAVWLRYYVIH